ncbi:MAG: nitrile hydratase subunit alpha [Chloroflexi bacterium]|nr:nitrile hydratase subunit alpha [Chloroflexota bacterium]MCY3937108.1 nitrile hydratase subunit alpha [Chloroflexota bacterium]
MSEKNPIEKAVQVVVAAWSDPAFKSELLADPRRALAGLGIEIPQGIDLDVRDNDGDVHHVIVCTQCSCWPTFLSPMPPFWKNSEYIARVVADPRTALIEMGLTLDPDEPVNVVDTTPRRRAMVIPRRPSASEGQTAAALAPYVNNLNIAGYAR